MSRRVHTHYVPEPVGDPLPDLFFIAEEPRVFQWDGPKPTGTEPIAKVVAPFQRVDTSLEAARKITQHTARIREAIWLYIKAVGGATAGEIATGCGLNPSTVRPRLRELQGDAPWAKGKLPARIWRTSEKRDGMRVYQIVGGTAEP